MFRGQANPNSQALSDDKVDPKDYPLFQLKQAFEAKEFDAKKVIAILEDKTFRPRKNGLAEHMPTKEAIKYLPLWTRVICSFTAEGPFAKFLLLFLYHIDGETCNPFDKKPQEITLPSELSAATDVESFIENYRQFLKVETLKTFPYMEVSEPPINESIQDMEVSESPVDKSIRVRSFNIRKNALAKTFELCIGCFEEPEWSVPITKDEIVEVMQQLMLALGKEPFRKLCLESHVNYFSNIYKLPTRDISTQRIASNTECLEHVLLAMDAVSFDASQLRLAAIYETLIKLSREKDPLGKDLLSASAIAYISSVKARDLIVEHTYFARGEACLLKLILKCYHSDSVLNAMLMSLIDSGYRLHDIGFQTVAGQVKRRDTPLEYLCLQAGAFSPQEFEATLKVLMDAGYDPAYEVTRSGDTKNEIDLIEVARKNYLTGIRNTLSPFINYDPSNVAVSYFFRPADSLAERAPTPLSFSMPEKKAEKSADMERFGHPTFVTLIAGDMQYFDRPTFVTFDESSADESSSAYKSSR